MQLPIICIKRPVFTIVLSIILIAVGAISFTKLEVRGTPSIAFPTINVGSFYAGADASFMDKEVTERVEKAIKTVKNIDSITSTSGNSWSQVTVSLKLDADIDEALSDIRSRVSDISEMLPEGMSIPSVTKIDLDAWPSFWISVNSNSHDSLELTRIVENQIKSVLERLPSVGEAKMFGSRNYSMNIKPINTKMVQHGLTPFELEKAINEQNKDYPAGSIKTSSKKFVIKLSGSLNSAEEFGNIIVKKYPSGSIVRLNEVAEVNIEPYEKNVYLRYNAKNSLAVGLVKQSTANIIELSNDARAELVKIRKNLPKGVSADIAYDASAPVKASINSVYFTIFEAVILVGLVTYLFLGSVSISIIPLVTIPISLIATFSVINWLGFSINTFTLLAMILAIGLVVDDAIVMLENIFRHTYELGKQPIQAAKDASKEIGFAIIAMTITLAAVFLPIGFLEGFVGKLFIEFAWTLAFCVLFSGFVALTLTPMMSSRMINPDREGKKANFIVKFDSYLKRTQDIYIKYLIVALANKKKFFGICLLSIIVLICSFVFVNKTFIPSEDQGFLRVMYSGPEGSSVQDSLNTVMQTEKVVLAKESINGFLNIVGSGGSDSAFAFVPLKKWNERSKHQSQIQNELNQEFVKIPGMSIFAISPPSMGSRRGDKEIEFFLQTNQEYDDLDKMSLKFVRKMRKNPVFFNPERYYKSSTPTLDIVVNREKAYRYGVDMATIGGTVQYLIAGKEVGEFRIGTNTYSSIIRYGENDRNSLADLKRIMVRNNQGEFLPIESVADVSETITVKSYRHYNGQKAIKFSASLAKGRTLTEALSEIRKMTDNLLDRNIYKIEFVGEIAQLEESNSGSRNTFLFALLFIFLVLSAQFESFSDSLLIMMAVPFSITGALFSLWLSGDSVNMYSNIGMITLIGLVTKNSIMIIEFINQLREQGKSIYDAVIESVTLRLRPILMTSIATISGAIPLAFASGAGAAARNSIGITIIGGMLIGTLFTLFVIPVLYQTFKREY